MKEMIRKVKATRNNGQALVETALVLPILLILIIAVLDPFLFMVNNGIARLYASRYVHEASVWMPGDVASCHQRWTIQMPADYGMVGAVGISATVTPCSSDLNWTPTPGDIVTAKITFTYDPLWYPNSWHGEVTALETTQ